MPSTINQAIYKLLKRAEKYDKEHLIMTFVDVGPLLTLLQNSDHQILYGRRGTGKTHAFSFLQGELEEKGHLPIYLDMRNIGSNGGIYTDISLGITERATRLLIDTFSLIHDGILDYVLTNDSKCDLSRFGPILDELANAISEIQVVGNLEVEETDNNNKGTKEEMGATFDSRGISISMKDEKSVSRSFVQRKKIIGPTKHRVHFTTINYVFSKIRNTLQDTEIWILIDEWAEVPLDLQPYLADLLRRTIFSIRGITLKIAAIEKRTNFKIDLDNGYIGIETGADISASLNLDEFMVFDNDPEKSKGFFKTLIYNHVNQFLEGEQKAVGNADSFVSSTFTQVGALEELVRASEGIPRDAINILIHAAIKADGNKISIPNIRVAARNWYSQDKEKSVLSNSNAKLLLRYIIDEVIGRRNSRAFLLNTDIQDKIIEYLFDNRILHIIKQNISSNHSPGERFNVYTIDYGAYVNLINTVQEPKGLFLVEINEGEEVFIDVPINDYRSIRKSILNLEEFYLANGGAA